MRRECACTINKKTIKNKSNLNIWHQDKNFIEIIINFFRDIREYIATRKKEITIKGQWSEIKSS